MHQNEYFNAVAEYLERTTGLDVIRVTYAGTHSNEGLFPVIHYNVEYVGSTNVWPFVTRRNVQVIVTWDNEKDDPTIIRADVIIRDE